MSKRLAICLFLLATLMLPPSAVQATNLTSGTYTYVINGEEATFPFDPIKYEDDLLLPVELFQRFDITLAGTMTRSITLKKRDVEVHVTLGSRASAVDGRPTALSAAPLRIKGRLFLPSDLLKHFGVEFRQKDTFLTLQDDAAALPPIGERTEAEFKQLMVGRHFRASAKTSSGVFLTAEWTLLNRELLTATNLDLSFGARARLHSLMESYSVVLVTLANYSFKSGTLDTTALFLVDQLRNQYDLVNTVDIGQGSITATIAPSATRSGVLLFPKAMEEAETFHLYYDVNSEILGHFNHLR